MAYNIDPTQPTQAEMQDHAIRVAKINLASQIAGAFARNPNVDPSETSAAKFAEYSAAVADRIFDIYTQSAPENVIIN